MIVIDCFQGDATWFKIRLGCVTSSRIADVVAKRKRVKAGEKPEELAVRRNMRLELMGELITEKATEHYVSRWMKEGKEKEPLARTAYEFDQDVIVEQVGYLCHPTISMAGCSPDGLIAKDGFVEFKCPKLETHLEYLMDDKIPEEYEAQMRWQLACDPERQWNDFVSFHPDCKEPFQIFRKRMERTKENQAIISGMELEVVQFLGEVDAAMADLKAKVTP